MASTALRTKLAISVFVLACSACISTEQPLGPAVDESGIVRSSAEDDAMPEEARVMFLEPTDGAVVSGPLVDGKVSVLVAMGLTAAEVRPAGDHSPQTGHHHILFDKEPM